MCMTRQSVLCMNTHIHTQREKKTKEIHLSPTAVVCQGAERDLHSLSKQSKATNNKQKTMEAVSEGLVHQAVIQKLFVTLLQASQFVEFRIFFQSIWDKREGLSKPENPSSTGHHWQLLKLYGALLQQTHTDKSLSTQPVRLQEPFAQTVVFGTQIHLK